MSSQTRYRTWVIISAPTMTSAGAAASDGTIWTSGVKNMATRNSRPVDDAGQAGAGAVGDAGGALDVGRVRRDAARAAGRRGEGVDQQDRLRLGQVPVLVEQAALGTDGGHGADGVEEVGDHDREDDEQRGDDADPLEAAEQREVADSERSGLPTTLSGSCGTCSAQPCAFTAPSVAEPRADVGDRLDDDREDRGGDDADQQRALHLADDEHGHQQQADDEDEDRPAGELPVDAETDQRVARAG